MIRRLALDAMRLLIRPRTAGGVGVVAVVFGFFVRATQQKATSELAGVDVIGSSLQSLMSGVFLFATCIALVFGVLLAIDDRETGLISQLAIRPVSRASYVIGRGFGLALATVLATLLLFLVAFGVSNVGLGGIPNLRAIERAKSVIVSGHEIGEGDVASIDNGEIARFSFEKRRDFDCEFRVDALPKIGVFTGKTRFLIKIFEGTSEIERFESEGRFFGTYGFRGLNSNVRGDTIEVENKTEGAALGIASDQLVIVLSRASGPSQLAFGLLLLLLASMFVAMFAFCFSTALSVGPAALCAGFFLLVSLARGSVLDLVADTFDRGSAMRGWLSSAVRLVPDLARFDIAERFGRGEALLFRDIVGLTGLALLHCAVALVLAASLLSWRDRR